MVAKVGLSYENGEYRLTMAERKLLRRVRICGQQGSIEWELEETA